MAWPTKDQDDYNALKQCVVQDIRRKKRNKTERKEYWRILNQEVEVSDERLKNYIGDIIRKDLQKTSFNILIEAKKSKKAISAYYNFINAYRLFKEGQDSYGNICCLAIDNARELLKS